MPHALRTGKWLAFDIYISYIYHDICGFGTNPAKAAANVSKHGVWFADTEGVFNDPLVLTVEDPDALGERRVHCNRIGKLERAAGGRLFRACGGVPLDLGSPCHAKGTHNI
jgi:hypothetical protein